MLSAVLSLISTQQASPYYGVFLLCLYILGLSIPFLILSIASTLAFKVFNLAKKRLMLLKKLGGLVIVLMGLAIIWAQLPQILH